MTGMLKSEMASAPVARATRAQRNQKKPPAREGAHLKRFCLCRAAILLAVLLAVLFSPGAARAACSNPAGNAGNMIYNNDHHVMQYCDTTNWIGMGPNGAGGAGCSSPAGSEGHLMYNNDHHVMQYCNGANWQGMAPNGGVLIAGLVGWWKLDDGSGTSAADSSGNGDAGALAGGTWTASGKIGGALTFNGTSDQVNIPSSANYNSTTGTWAFWFNTTDAACTRCELMSRADASQSCNGILIYLSGSAHVIANIYGAGCGGTYDTAVASSTTGLNDGNWHHVALTFNGTTAADLYIDGSLETSNTAYGAWSFNSQPVRLGQAQDSYWQLLAGTIDDVRVYNRALSAAEVAEIYNGAGGSGVCTSPAGSEGNMIYNNDHNVMQYCNGTSWVGIGK